MNAAGLTQCLQAEHPHLKAMDLNLMVGCARPTWSIFYTLRVQQFIFNRDDLFLPGP
jgi:hypothetical protein